jgi:excisionase family DNA binding protein
MTKRTTQDESALMSPREASLLAGISTRTLARMADRGDIRSTTPTGSRHRRYFRAEVTALTTASEATPHASEALLSEGGAA